MFTPRRYSFRILCWLLAVLTPLTPSLAVYAQEADASAEETKFVLPYSAAIASLRPRQVLTCEAVQMLPVEVVQAACIKELGFDPLLVEQVIVSGTPPIAGPPSFAIAIDFTERIDLAKLSPKLTEHTVPGERDGQSYLKSQSPELPSLIWAGDTKLLVAPEHVLNQLLSSKRTKEDKFAQAWSACATDDFALLVNMGILRPFIQLGMNQAANEIPAEFQKFLEIPSLLEQARLRMNFSGAGPHELSFAAKDAESADRIGQLIEEGLDIYREQAILQAQTMLQSEDPVEQAMGRYITRITPAWTEQLVPARSDERFTIFDISEKGQQNQFASIAVIGVLVALLLPAVQAAREAARRNVSMNNIKQLMLSLHNYHDAHRHFPAHANYSAEGKPLLSWRVHILPYLEQDELYSQFHLDEPWDSPHNRQLIPLIPPIFVDPSSRLADSDGRTHYLAVIGDEMTFSGTERGRSIISFRDGTPNTIMIVQCNDQRAAIWTKPDDWEWNEKSPLAGLVPCLHPGAFLAGFADGHVSAISEEINIKLFKAMLTRDGGEQIPATALR